MTAIVFVITNLVFKSEILFSFCCGYIFPFEKNGLRVNLKPILPLTLIDLIIKSLINLRLTIKSNITHINKIHTGTLETSLIDTGTNH